MKNWKNYRPNLTSKGEDMVPSVSARLTGKEPASVKSKTGMTQENYINPKYLGVSMVASITKMSFMGLWV